MRLIRKMAVTLCAVCLLLSVQIVPAFAVGHGYGYWFLTDKQKGLYDMIAEAVGRCAGQIPLDVNQAITWEDAERTMLIFAADYPEYSWFGVKNGSEVRFFGAYGSDTIASMLEPCYNSYDASGHLSALQSRASAIIATIPASATSQYDKALYLHDYLAQHVTYNFSDSNTMTSYGALVNGSAGCCGYAKAYQYLLQCCGITAWTVQGTGMSSSGAVPHAWNAANLDGCWYYIDVTWDDTAAVVTHQYFGLSLSGIAQDHIANVPYSSILPSGGSGTRVESAPAGVTDTTKPAKRELTEEEVLQIMREMGISTATDMAATEAAATDATETDATTTDATGTDAGGRDGTTVLWLCGGAAVVMLGGLLMVRGKRTRGRRQE